MGFEIVNIFVLGDGVLGSGNTWVWDCLWGCMMKVVCILGNFF